MNVDASLLFHTDDVSIDVVVRQVQELLTRAHTLFADPAPCGASLTTESGTGLADAGQQWRPAATRATAMSGRLAGDYRQFTDSARAELSALAERDDQLARNLEHAERTQHQGGFESAGVLGAAAADAAALAPLTRAPAGQQALLHALRTRVAQQQRLLRDAQAGAVDIAAALHALTYAPAPTGGEDGGPPDES